MCAAQHSIATLTATQMAVDLLHALKSVAQPIKRLGEGGGGEGCGGGEGGVGAPPLA